MHPNGLSLTVMNRRLESGQTTPQRLAEESLQRVVDSLQAEHNAVILRCDPEAVRAQARAATERQRSGRRLSPIDGMPISIKDLFDVQGQVTRAGSIQRSDAAPAKCDATAVARLRAAGAVLIARTNMTEFAFSGLGLNPHFGTPRSPWQREAPRIAGGSSSGAAVSVTDGMALAALGTDTGGSVRIPAAFCGLTGFKPTARRIPMDGVLPLAPALDSVGPLASSVECCDLLDSILNGSSRPPAPAIPLSGVRFVIPTNVVWQDADSDVREIFWVAVTALRRLGAQVEERRIPELDAFIEINRQGGLVCAEAWRQHQRALADSVDLYDPRVSSRIALGQQFDDTAYQDLFSARRNWQLQMGNRLAEFDALMMPTVPIVPPRLDELQESDDTYFATNRIVLRNPSIVNFWDGCAISMPCQAAGQPPVGLTLAGPPLSDIKLLSIARAVEQGLPRVAC